MEVCSLREIGFSRWTNAYEQVAVKKRMRGAFRRQTVAMACTATTGLDSDSMAVTWGLLLSSTKMQWYVREGLETEWTTATGSMAGSMQNQVQPSTTKCNQPAAGKREMKARQEDATSNSTCSGSSDLFDVFDMDSSGNLTLTAYLAYINQTHGAPNDPRIRAPYIAHFHRQVFPLSISCVLC
jgi:hypothetical protein